MDYGLWTQWTQPRPLSHQEMSHHNPIRHPQEQSGITSPRGINYPEPRIKTRIMLENEYVDIQTL